MHECMCENCADVKEKLKDITVIMIIQQLDRKIEFRIIEILEYNQVINAERQTDRRVNIETNRNHTILSTL